MEYFWDGVNQLEALGEVAAEIRIALADASKSGDWATMIGILSEYPDYVNSGRPGGASLFTPLHQVAYSGAPVEIAQRLIDLGAFRTIENARGERPVDVADLKGHRHLHDILKPVLYHHVPEDVLKKIQANFHTVIRGRIDSELPNHNLRLPELAPLLELREPSVWFPVPGMYGGFSYELDTAGEEAKLMVSSWSRVVGGSGQRHEVTARGSELVEEGFV